MRRITQAIVVVLALLTAIFLPEVSAQTLTTTQPTIATATTVTSGYTEVPAVCSGSTCNAQQGDVLGHQIVTGGATVDGAVATSAATTSTLAATIFSVKASAGNLYGVHFYNGAATTCYIQIFDKASGSVSLGSDTPALTVAMPTVAANALQNNPVPLKYFGTAISAASTTTATGSTPCGTVTFAEFLYK